jgi:hypothetical protein
MFVRVSEEFVSPFNAAPFFNHWKPNGPVPCGDAAKETVVPGQLVCEAIASTTVGSFTVRLAWFVTVLQSPDTCTE